MRFRVDLSIVAVAMRLTVMARVIEISVGAVLLVVIGEVQQPVTASHRSAVK